MNGLLEFIDLSQLNCLNEAEDHTFKSIVSSKSINTTTSYLLSDVDAQLLLNIPFNQTVHVRSIVLQSKIKEQAPKIIKLFVNQPSLGFENVDNPSQQDLEISEQGKAITLNFVRFQRINSLHIFVESNHSDGDGDGASDRSRIDALDIFGLPVETTKDLSGLRKQE